MADIVTDKPEWTDGKAVTFAHAPRWLKALAKDQHIAPNRYAMKAQSGGSFEGYMWNSKKVSHFNAADQRYWEKNG